MIHEYVNVLMYGIPLHDVILQKWVLSILKSTLDFLILHFNDDYNDNNKQHPY